MNLLSKLIFLLLFVSTALPMLASAADNQPRRLTILTSYPPEFYQPFIRGYKTLYPAVQLQSLNKKTTAAKGRDGSMIGSQAQSLRGAAISSVSGISGSR